jgi:hypothetical protein
MAQSYRRFMSDTATLLTTRLASLDAELNDLRDKTAAKEKERSDVEIAIRVIAEVSGHPIVPAKPVAEAATRRERPASEKRALILELLGTGESAGRSPSSVAAALRNRNVFDIPIEIVRTTLWRMAKRDNLIGSGDGRYWKFESSPQGETGGSDAPGPRQLV